MVQNAEKTAPRDTGSHLEKFTWFEDRRRQPSWLLPLRKAGLARFAEQGYPTLKQEDWRFTDVAPIAKLPFRPLFEVSEAGITAAAIAQFTFARLPASRLATASAASSTSSSTARWIRSSGSPTSAPTRASATSRRCSETVDDKFAIIWSGDEITVRFTAPPPPAPSLTLRFIVHGHAYYKDHTSVGPREVEPLPFNAMSNYPYDEAVEHYPDDGEHIAYRHHYNRRQLP